MLITGLNGFICDECAQQAYEIVRSTGMLKGAKGKANEKFKVKKVPKPAEIKAYLDQYVIGQDEAKRYLSVAIFRWRSTITTSVCSSPATTMLKSRSRTLSWQAPRERVRP